MNDDGMEDVTLEADYGPHKAGETVRVDPARAEWIRARGRKSAASSQVKTAAVAVKEDAADG